MYTFSFCPYTVWSVPSSLVNNCLERADLMALLDVMFLCDVVTFPYGVSGQMWYLIVSISDLCLLLYLSAWSSLILVQTFITCNQLLNRKLADEHHFQLRF